MLGGYLIAYLNLDKVIKIIRTEDEPKPVLIRPSSSPTSGRFHLNMRLRSLRKLEEMEIREDKDLRNELKGIKAVLASEEEQWKKVGEQVRKVRDTFGPKTPLGKRRTQFADAPEHDLAAIEEALIEREPITVVVSDKGWVRTLKGHVEDLSNLAFKTDDSMGFSSFAESTSKLTLFASNGRFYTLDAQKLPGGRGHGDPIRMTIDMEGDADIVSMFVQKGGRKFLVASSDGQGFVVNEDDCVANTRKGAVLNVSAPNRRGNRDRDRRYRRRHRHQPQDGDFPAGASAGNGARPWCAPAEVQRRQAVRRDDVHVEGWHDVEGLGRPRTSFGMERTRRLAWQPCGCGPFGARLPEVEQVRQSDRVVCHSGQTAQRSDPESRSRSRMRLFMPRFRARSRCERPGMTKILQEMFHGSL